MEEELRTAYAGVGCSPEWLCYMQYVDVWY